MQLTTIGLDFAKSLPGPRDLRRWPGRRKEEVAPRSMEPARVTNKTRARAR